MGCGGGSEPGLLVPDKGGGLTVPYWDPLKLLSLVGPGAGLVGLGPVARLYGPEPVAGL